MFNYLLISTNLFTPKPQHIHDSSPSIYIYIHLSNHQSINPATFHVKVKSNTDATSHHGISASGSKIAALS